MSQYSDDAIQSFICDLCWKGPFSAESFSKMLAGHEIGYATTWSRIKTSANSGCRFCNLLITDEARTAGDSANIRLMFGKVNHPEYTSPSNAQMLGVEFEDDVDLIPNNGYWIYTATDDPASSDIIARDPIKQSNTKEANSWALHCLARCLEEHPGCPKFNEQTPFPTRVIDCSEVDHPRLIITGGLSGAYVALSYVWGQSQPNSLSASNLATYKLGVDISLIPRTILDAIRVVQALGLRYLWVDSFCIIQDSREDKVREIARMRAIFHDAYLTLIAASAPTVATGFLQDRADLCHVRLPFRCSNGRLGTMALLSGWVHYDENADPVNQRAWCLEERLLSPRRLVFGADTLQYHCQTSAIAYDNAILSIRSGERLPPPLLDSDADIYAWRANAKHHETRRVRWSWMDTLKNYTRRALTHQHDKLVALGGVAEQFQRIWSTGRYLAGIWEETLTYDLLWSTDPDTKVRPRGSQYLAPTWSWASVDTPIHGGRALDQCIDPYWGGDVHACEVLDCTVSLKNPELNFGGVTSGKLTLRAPAFKVAWNPSLLENLVLFSHQPGTGFEFCVLDADLGVSQSRLRIGSVFADIDDERRPSEALAVVIRWNTKPSQLYTAGILVVPGSDGKLRRIGYWESAEEDGLDDHTEQIMPYINNTHGQWALLEIV